MYLQTIKKNKQMQALTQEQKDFTKNMTVFMYNEVVPSIVPALKELRTRIDENSGGSEQSKIKITLTIKLSKPPEFGLSVEF